MTLWKRHARKLLLLTGLLLFTSSLLAKGRRPPEIHFTMEPATVTQGHTLQVYYRSSVPLKNAALYFNGNEAVFFDHEGSQQRALLGVASTQKPGKAEATFYAEGRKGQVIQSTVTFFVGKGDYPKSRVKLPKRKNKLITSGALTRDAKTLRTVYQKPQAEKKLWAGLFVLPSTGIPTSPFGARRVYSNGILKSAHSGYDLANKAGTLIFAPNRGVVVFADWLDSFGHVVVLDHGLGVYSYYLHMKKILTEKGKSLKTGDPVGEMGSEGLSTGSHLHWSLAVAGERVNPIEWTEKEFK